MDERKFTQVPEVGSGEEDRVEHVVSEIIKDIIDIASSGGEDAGSSCPGCSLCGLS